MTTEQTPTTPEQPQTAPEVTPTTPEQPPTTPEQPQTAPEVVPSAQDPAPSTVVLSELVEALKTLQTAPEVTPEPTPDQPKTDQTLTPDLARKILIKAYSVPEDLQDLIPADIQKATEYLDSPGYSKLVQKLSLTTNPQPLTAQEQTTPAPKSGQRADPTPEKPKTFGDPNLKIALGQALEGKI